MRVLTTGTICATMIVLLGFVSGCGGSVVPQETRVAASSETERPAGRRVATAQSTQYEQAEQEILRRINEQRRKQGLEPLVADPRLTSIARAYSRRMAADDFFEHTAPEGDTLVDRLKAVGVRYRFAGENLYKGYNVPDTAADAVANWMRSSGHRKNILRPEFRQTGIGVWKNGRTVYVTQVFLRQ